MAKLYVGNLSETFSDTDLQALFAEVGKVTSAVVVKSNLTYKNLGFGIVELDDDLAMDAIMKFNGLDLNGHKLTVSIIKT
jgi:RNA recognition motif-containing protein